MISLDACLLSGLGLRRGGTHLRQGMARQMRQSAALGVEEMAGLGFDAERDLLMDAGRIIAGGLGHDQRLSRHADVEIGLPAEALGDGHLAHDFAICRGHQMLRPDAERRLVARAEAAGGYGNGDLPAARQDDA